MSDYSRKRPPPKVGDTFGRLRVVERVAKGTWRCECECGASAMVHGNKLTAGRKRSCGCGSVAARALGPQSLRTHGSPPGYSSWRSMVARCTDPSNKSFARYGARGITVCARWAASFEAFAADMGPRPSAGHSIDRINNAKGYDPSNCRWATAREQQNNRRCNVVVAAFGESMTVPAWARLRGLSRATLNGRLRAGWPVEDALTTRTLTPRESRSRA